MSYLFYDVETTGLNPAFDQILRFGYVRADDELEEIERDEIAVRLREDVMPAPDAILTHGIGIEDARSSGLDELEAVRRIHRLVNEPETVSVGYNSLGFDDEFLRFSFYRNLLPPYTHQWKNDCGRMDIYPMAVVYFLRGSQVVEWPEDEEGVRLRLEDLTAVNGLTEGIPHTASADAEAAWSLARRFREDRKLWDRIVPHFDKKWDERRYDRLPAYEIGGRSLPVAVLVGGAFGRERGFRRPVVGLGRHEVYQNQTRWLALDGRRFAEAGGETVRTEGTVITKKFGQPHLISGLGDDALVPLDDERRVLANENLQWLRRHPDVLEDLVTAHVREAYDEIADVDVDAALYGGAFWDDRTQDRCREFHEAGEPHAMWRVAQRIDRPDLRTLAARVLFRNFPEDEVPAEVADRGEAYRHRILGREGEPVPRDYRDRERRTPEHVLEVIEGRRRASLGERERRLLAEYESYLRDLHHA